MQYINDVGGGGDNVQLKVNLQQDLIRDLIEQHEVLSLKEEKAKKKIKLLEKNMHSLTKLVTDVQNDSKAKDETIRSLNNDLQNYNLFIFITMAGIIAGLIAYKYNNNSCSV